jgi:HEAT repeat protein
MNAAIALESFGPRAATAIPNLQLLSNDPDEQVRRLATSAIKSIERKSAPTQQ